jgi:CubicO group peptidase (beta-lactamase class C family)
MTKPVTSVAVVMLMEEGELALDDPIGRYLPELAAKEVFEDFDFDTKAYTTRPARGEITVRHLLTHTSGLGYAFSNEILAALGSESAGGSVQGLPLLHDPGTRWTYGESTRVLGLLVEALSGHTLERFFEERIYTPLGMNDTWYAVPAEETARVATVHTSSPEGLVEWQNDERVLSPANGDGGLNSTAADFIKFTQMLLNGGRAADGTQLLREDSVKLMGRNHTGAVRVSLQPAASPVTRPFPLGADRDTFGLGFQITGAPREPDMRAPGSMSWAGIFNTEFWIDPEEGISAVLRMQYLPFYDDAAIEALQGFERRVYRHLE